MDAINVGQSAFNWLFGLVSLMLGSGITIVWGAVKDLQSADKQLVDRVAEIHTLVAGKYVLRSDLERLADMQRQEMQTMAIGLSRQLEAISLKLDSKADKPNH